MASLWLLKMAPPTDALFKTLKDIRKKEMKQKWLSTKPKVQKLWIFHKPFVFPVFSAQLPVWNRLHHLRHVCKDKWLPCGRCESLARKSCHRPTGPVVGGRRRTWGGLGCPGFGIKDSTVGPLNFHPKPSHWKTESLGVSKGGKQMVPVAMPRST